MNTENAESTDQLIEKINDLSVQLDFDNIVAECSKRPELNASEVKVFGRRLLEVALFAVRDIRAEPNPSDTISDFEVLKDRATALKKAGLELASHLAGKKFDTAASFLSATDRAAKPIFHMRRRQYILTTGLPSSKNEPKTDIDIDENVAKLDAKSLGDTIALAEFLSNYAAATRNEVASQRQNPGTPVKNAFAVRMLEGWIFLTGKKPSANNDSFKAALDCAWLTIAPDTNCGDWANSVRVASKTIGNENIESIKAQGPFWI